MMRTNARGCFATRAIGAEAGLEPGPGGEALLRDLLARFRVGFAGGSSASGLIARSQRGLAKCDRTLLDTSLGKVRGDQGKGRSQLDGAIADARRSGLSESGRAGQGPPDGGSFTMGRPLPAHDCPGPRRVAFWNAANTTTMSSAGLLPSR
jgi:hypothetical protein